MRGRLARLFTSRARRVFPGGLAADLARLEAGWRDGLLFIELGEYEARARQWRETSVFRKRDRWYSARLEGTPLWRDGSGRVSSEEGRHAKLSENRGKAAVMGGIRVLQSDRISEESNATDRYPKLKGPLSME